MKRLLPYLLLPALVVSAQAQSDFQTAAQLAKPNGENFRAWILAATDSDIRYKVTEISTDFTDAKRSEFAAIYILKPNDFAAAMDLYESGKYKVAQAKFAEIKEYHKPTSPLKDNFHTLSAFYEMECMRKLGDYEALTAALKDFKKASLTREHQVRQLDLYVLWDAVRTESWDRVLIMATERDSENLPGYQRAQVAYCKALALYHLKRPDEALLEGQIAITADSGGSEIIAQDAAILVMRILFEDPDVQLAIKLWGTEDENKNSVGYTRLKEAAALAALYELTLKAGKPLPADLKKFLDYRE